MRGHKLVHSGYGTFKEGKRNFVLPLQEGHGSLASTKRENIYSKSPSKPETQRQLLATEDRAGWGEAEQGRAGWGGVGKVRVKQSRAGWGGVGLGTARAAKTQPARRAAAAHASLPPVVRPTAVRCHTHTHLTPTRASIYHQLITGQIPTLLAFCPSPKCALAALQTPRLASAMPHTSPNQKPQRKPLYHRPKSHFAFVKIPGT